MVATIKQRDAELIRQKEINTIFSMFPDNQAIIDLKASNQTMNKTTEQIRADVMAALGGNTTPTGAVLPMSHVHAGNGDIVKQGMTAALTERIGLEKSPEKNNPFRTMSLSIWRAQALQSKALA